MADAGIVRAIGDFYADVTVKEQHRDDVTATKHPVERGASIADHIYKNAPKLSVAIGSKAGDQSLGDIYSTLLEMQTSATLLSVQTGKRLYDDMVILSIAVDTDEKTENVLLVTMQLEQMLLVDTMKTTMPSSSARASSQSTSGVANTGTKSTTTYTGATPTG